MPWHFRSDGSWTGRRLQRLTGRCSFVRRLRRAVPFLRSFGAPYLAFVQHLPRCGSQSPLPVAILVGTLDKLLFAVARKALTAAARAEPQIRDVFAFAVASIKEFPKGGDDGIRFGVRNKRLAQDVLLVQYPACAMHR